MTEGIYLIPSESDFLKVISEMIEFANNSSSRFKYLHKQLNSLKEIEKEVKLLNKCEINSFDGFYTKRLIKVSLSLHGELFDVSYTFNSSLFLYEKFKRYLKDRCLS